MNKNITYRIAGIALLLFGATMTTGCYDEPDKSALYTFTGETVNSFLTNRPEQFSNFSYILERSGYDRLMASYGSYTCFAPLNGAVMEYIDSLWRDAENEQFEHNGMTENSLAGLSDSLCKDIAEYHLCGQKYDILDMSGDGIALNTMLERAIITSVGTNGNTLLNDVAEVINENNKVVNGMIHVINKVVPRSNRLLPGEIERCDEFKLFAQALTLTGLADSLIQVEKTGVLHIPPLNAGYYTPEVCKMGYTVFAETDEVLARNGIETLDDLIAYANEIYGQCATRPLTEHSGWYDYYRNNNITVSTKTDYTNRANALNMFVAYHLIPGAMSRDMITTNYNIWAGNGYNGDAVDFFQTMLPKTLLKVWHVVADGITYINRQKANNTLTDEVESMGSEEMHTLVRPGVAINLDKGHQALNGYIYPLDGILVYDYGVPKGVLNERIRVDAVTMLPEMMSNGIRCISYETLKGRNGGVGVNRCRFPINYFENLVVYNGNNTTVDINIPQAYIHYQGDCLNGLGQFDLAIKLPPVPDGVYELRFDANLMKHGSMLQYYIGTSSDRSTMQAVGLPLDMRMDADDPRIGWTDPRLEADKGLETDRSMRYRGYMRGLLNVAQIDRWVPARYKGGVRLILVKQEFKQQDYWLRLKTVLPYVSNLKWTLDFVEFCPVSIANNEKYVEDMY